MEDRLGRSAVSSEPSAGARVLGVEGGGTKTEWLLAEAGADGTLRIIRAGVLSAANLKLIDDEGLRDLLSVLDSEATHVGAFLAGCASAADHKRLRRIVESVWPGARIVCGSDRESAMTTAFGGGDGMIAIAGTGAVVHGRSDRRIEKAGGWGQLLGDRGGGYHIGMQALRCALTHCDLDDEAPPFAHRILRMLGLNRPDELVDWVSQADKMSVARLAPVVFDAAREGDAEMESIVRAGAEILADYATAVGRKLRAERLPIRLFGGLFVNYPEYVALFRDRLGEARNASVEVCRESGALGAARLVLSDGKWGAAAVCIGSAAMDRGELAAAVTEQSNPRSANLERLSTRELVDLFVSEESRVGESLAACAAQLCAAIDVTAEALRRGGRLFYAGAGTSGRLGVLDASEIPPTFGASPEMIQGIIAGGFHALHRAVEGAEDEPEAGALSMLQRGVGTGDAVCGIASSGRTPFVLGALRKARELGASTIFLTCNPARARQAPPWDVEIDLPTGPELVTGSTRLKAGTATKVALNMLSTAVMIRLGKVRGNTMIDVSISNEKLRDRGVRIVSQSLNISYLEARERLEKSDWNVRACLASE